MDDALEKDLGVTISGFSKQQTGFEIDLKDFSAFKPRVIYIDVLQNEFLQTLHSQLQEFLKNSDKYPIEIEERPFHPHVTVAARDLHKKDFYKASEIFKEKKYEVSWKVNGISILKHDQKKWDVIFTSQFQN
jgi:2'-5' RNA ligase